MVVDSWWWMVMAVVWEVDGEHPARRDGKKEKDETPTKDEQQDTNTMSRAEEASTVLVTKGGELELELVLVVVGGWVVEDGEVGG